jgi:hypothetical protein
MTAGGMKGRWAGTSKNWSGEHDEYRALTMELLDMRYDTDARLRSSARTMLAGGQCASPRRKS